MRERDAQEMRQHLRHLLAVQTHWLILTDARDDRAFRRTLLEDCQTRATSQERWPRPVVEALALDLLAVDPDGEGASDLGVASLLVIPKDLLPVDACYAHLVASFGPGGKVEDVAQAGMICPVRVDRLWSTGALVQALREWLAEEG